jgi:hypothetical protein
MTIYTIYIIRHKNKDINWCYIGSTQAFRNRKYRHKSNCNNPNGKDFNFPVYQFIRANGGWDEFEMIPVEEYECENNTQARIREEYWRVFYEAKGNCIRAYQSEEELKEYMKQYDKQYRNEHKEKIKQKSKKYWDKHKEELKQKSKKYWDEHKEELKQKNKQYKDKHREETKQYNKQYYERNKDKFKQYYENK